MRQSKTHTYEQVQRLGDLRAIVNDTQHMDDRTPVNIREVEGDQRDPGYVVISVTSP